MLLPEAVAEAFAEDGEGSETAEEEDAGTSDGFEVAAFVNGFDCDNYGPSRGKTEEEWDAPQEWGADQLSSVPS